MMHLTTTYSAISHADLEQNLHELDRDWDPDTKLTTFFSQQCKIQQFAANDTPVPDKMLLCKAIIAICNTGILNTDIDTFRKCPTNKQAYANFKTDLLKAYKLCNTESAVQHPQLASCSSELHVYAVLTWQLAATNIAKHACNNFDFQVDDQWWSIFCQHWLIM